MDRLLRAVVANLERFAEEVQVTDFKPDRPWNTLWLHAVNDVTWYELFDPSLFHLNRRASTVSQVGHDARTGFSNNVGAEADRGSSLQSEEPPNLKRLTGDKKHHETTGGQYTHNRKGKPLCPEYNSGRCSKQSGAYGAEACSHV